MLDIGANLIKGIWNGIKSAKDWIFKKIGGFCDGIVDGFCDAFGINSPSRRMRDEVGIYTAQGIEVGFEEESDNTIKGMTDKMQEVVGKMQGVVSAENIRSGQIFTIAKEDITSENGSTNTSNGMIQAVFNIDGKPVMEAIAPYQGVLENYNVGRS